VLGELEGLSAPLAAAAGRHAEEAKALQARGHRLVSGAGREGGWVLVKVETRGFSYVCVHLLLSTPGLDLRALVVVGVHTLQVEACRTQVVCCVLRGAPAPPAEPTWVVDSASCMWCCQTIHIAAAVAKPYTSLLLLCADRGQAGGG
jgi:hypothetical protein